MVKLILLCLAVSLGGCSLAFNAGEYNCSEQPPEHHCHRDLLKFGLTVVLLKD